MKQNIGMQELILFTLLHNDKGMYSEEVLGCIQEAKKAEVIFKKKGPPKRKSPGIRRKTYYGSLSKLVEQECIIKVQQKNGKALFLRLSTKGLIKATEIYNKHQDFLSIFSYLTFRKDIEKEIDDLITEAYEIKDETERKEKMLEPLTKLYNIFNKSFPARRYVIRK